MEEIFESSVRSAGDLAGVFEFDGDTSYFYLYRVGTSEGNKVVDAIKVSVGEPDYSESDIEIRWSAGESLVSLLIAGQICAVFDCDGAQKFGGDYVAGAASKVPPGILARLVRE
jgi:hypothetical protein